MLARHRVRYPEPRTLLGEHCAIIRAVAGPGKLFGLIPFFQYLAGFFPCNTVPLNHLWCNRSKSCTKRTDLRMNGLYKNTLAFDNFAAIGINFAYADLDNLTSSSLVFTIAFPARSLEADDDD